MLFKSPIFSQASGSIGGTTFSRNRGGMYTRNRAIPTNPNTANQAAVRGYLGSAVSAWSNLLSAGQREAWRTYGNETPVINRLGDETRLTGQQQFIRSFVAFSRAGLSPVLAAPTIYNTGEPVVNIGGGAVPPNTVEIVASVFTADAMLMAAASDGGNVAIGIGPPVNPGVEYYGGRANFMQAAALVNNATSAALDDTAADWANPWGLPTAGERRGMVARVLYDDGRVSQQYRAIVDFVSS